MRSAVDRDIVSILKVSEAVDNDAHESEMESEDEARNELVSACATHSGDCLVSIENILGTVIEELIVLLLMSHFF